MGITAEQQAQHVVGTDQERPAWSWYSIPPLSVAVPVCRFDSFLGERESGRLLGLTQGVGTRLRQSQVADYRTDPDTRRSRSATVRVPSLEQAVLRVLPVVQELIEVEVDPDVDLDYHFTAHNDGDFYRPHTDAGPGWLSARTLTFVYYLHRTPRPFTGGCLRIFDTQVVGGHARDAATFRDIEPAHDSIVFFPASARHEVRPVSCPSRTYADSRFAFNGWLHQPHPTP